MTLIDKAEAQAMLRKHANGETVLGGQVYQSLTLETALETIDALPARGVGVPADVKDYAIDVSEAYDTMMEVQRNPAGAWQVIQALAGHIAALAPTDAAQARAPCPPYGATGDDCCGGYCGMDEASPGVTAEAGASQAREVEVYYKLRWISGARPPAHPEPMNGSQTFSTEEKARAFFRSLASDAKFVSLERIEVTSTALIGETRT